MSGSKFLTVWKLLVVFMMLMSSIGCTHHFVAQQCPMKPGMVPEFSGGQPVTIANARDAPEQVLIGSQGIHKWMGNLQQWTDTAIGLVKTELEKRKIMTTEGANRQLKLSITRANIYWGFASIRCITSLKVETGDGYVREFEGNNVSPWTLHRACNGAITRAVAAMLNDDTILAYLKY